MPKYEISRSSIINYYVIGVLMKFSVRMRERNDKNKGEIPLGLHEAIR